MRRITGSRPRPPADGRSEDYESGEWPAEAWLARQTGKLPHADHGDRPAPDDLNPHDLPPGDLIVSDPLSLLPDRLAWGMDGPPSREDDMSTATEPITARELRPDHAPDRGQSNTPWPMPTPTVGSPGYTWLRTIALVS
jgi:hypothetical protein